MTGWHLVLNVYLVSWTLVAGYAAYVVRRDRHMHFELPARVRVDRAA